MNQNPFTQRLLDTPLATVADFYAQHLNENAHSFLKKNCLSADSVLRVGYSDRSLGKQIPDKQLKLGREIRAKLKQVGIIKANGRETLRGFITLPLTDIEGNTTGIYGERIDKKGKPEPRLTIGSGIFNATAFDSFDEIILCETVLDAWTFHAAGQTNAIAIEEQQLKKEMFASFRRVLLAASTIDHSIFDGIDLMQIHLPEDTTANQYAIVNRTVDDALGKRIRAASVVDRGVGCQPAINAATKNTESTEQEPTRKEPNDTKGEQLKKKTPAASPTPEPIDDIEVERSETEVTLRIESRRWRVRGLDRNTTTGVMKINLMIFSERNERFHVDTLDLYHSRSRRVYLKEAAEETALSESELRSDLGRVLLKLEELQEEQRAGGRAEAKPVELTDAERSEAMNLLNDENLLDRILDDFDACGIVGEKIGKLTGYLVATSRLLQKPLGLVIQSSSAAGKTSLLDSILAFMPPESQFGCSAMTSKSLYYAGNLDLRHKILSIAEEEGVRDASYALKLLQSEGKLSIVTTTKESGTGRTTVERSDVQGPVATLLTTTASDVDAELMNRCFVVSVDEDSEQTDAIQRRQRQAETIDAIMESEQAEHVRKLHQNAQRLLEPIRISNPFADQLTFTDRAVRNRRDQAKYLGLIRAITFLHQHQRERKVKTKHGKTIEYIETTRQDIAVANMIADAVLGTSIDELPQQTRKLLLDLYRFVRAKADAADIDEREVRFTRREVREATGWAATQLRFHLERLCRWEYVIPHGGGGRGKLTEYELWFDGRGYEGQPTICGLTDAASLTDPTTTDKLSG